MLGTLKWTRSMLSLVTNFLRCTFCDILVNKNRKLLQLKIQKRKMKIHFLDTNLNFPDKLKTQILEKSFNVQKNWELTLNFQSFLMRFSTHLISKVNFSSVLRQKYIWKPLTFILGKDCMKKPFLTIQRQRLKRNQNLLWLNFTIVFMLHKFSNQLEEMRFLFLSITKLKVLYFILRSPRCLELNRRSSQISSLYWHGGLSLSSWGVLICFTLFWKG